jgi:hypothetical protein
VGRLNAEQGLGDDVGWCVDEFLHDLNSLSQGLG